MEIIENRKPTKKTKETKNIWQFWIEQQQILRLDLCWTNNIKNESIQIKQEKKRERERGKVRVKGRQIGRL